MISLKCANGHHSTVSDTSTWRQRRSCTICGDYLLVNYGTECEHHSWRYPNRYPADGDICKTTYVDGQVQVGCGAAFVAPTLGLDEATLEQLRGLGEIRGETEAARTMVRVARETEQRTSRITYSANRKIQDLCYLHGFLELGDV